MTLCPVSFFVLSPVAPSRLRKASMLYCTQVEGPYSVSPCMPQDHVIVLVAGGMGITPMLGMLRAWATAADDGDEEDGLDPQPPSAVFLCWTVRNLEELQLLDSRLVEIAR